MLQSCGTIGTKSASQDVASSSHHNAEVALRLDVTPAPIGEKISKKRWIDMLDIENWFQGHVVCR